MEFVSSGIQKTSQDFKPKVSRKRRVNVEADHPLVVEPGPKEPDAQAILEDSQLIVHSTPIQKVCEVNNDIVSTSPRAISVVTSITKPEVQLKKVSQISIPTHLHTETIIEKVGQSMVELINDPFEQGRLSKHELNRRAKLKSKKTEEIKEVVVEDIAKVTGGLKIVDGKMVVEEIVEEFQYGPAVEEDFEGRYITSASFSTKRKLISVKWTAAMTDRFYDGISYFGCNFYMISLMFPSLVPNHIQRKFKLEDKKNSDKITAAIRNRRDAPDEIKERMQSGIARKKELVGAQMFGVAAGDSRVIKSDGKIDKANIEGKDNEKDLKEIQSNIEEKEIRMEEIDAIEDLNNVIMEQIVEGVELPELVMRTSSTAQQVGTGPIIKKRRKLAQLSNPSF